MKRLLALLIGALLLLGCATTGGARRGFARSFSLSLRGNASYLQPHETVYIQVGASPNLSYIGRR